MAVIEIATFRLAGDDDSFLAADHRMQTKFAYQQPGCVRRTTARGNDGEWLVMTMWSDDAAAQAAAAAAEQHPVAVAFWTTVVPDSVTRQRFTTLPG
jgi:hypothetical protein